MALVLLTGGTTRGLSAPEDEILSAYAFDATVKLLPRFSSELTQHPVESGANINDHIITKNLVIDLEAVVSRNPIAPNQGVDFDTSVPALSDDLFVGNDPEDRGRINTAYKILVEAFKSKSVITVASELEVYTNCVITSLQFPRSAEVGDSLKVTAVLEQAQIVKSKFAPISLSLLDSATTNKAKGGKGGIDTSRTDDPQASYTERFFKSLFSGVFK